MSSLKYWVWLTSKRTINAHKIMLLLEHFDDIYDIYDAEAYDGIDEINAKEKRELLDKSLLKAEKIIKKVEMLGGRIVTFDDPTYPEPLKRILPPPYVLYMKGKEIDWNNLAISVIGSRECTPYGRVAAQKLSYEMASAGVTIVSGMARGIDSIAAISALKAGGNTVAVIGSGLDVVYPPEHGGLMRAIEENGLIITEYPPSTPPYGHNFPERNRIISGLSKGLLVVEACMKSGTAITAARARDYGRDIFAVPGGIFHDHSEGTNNMIKMGAILTNSVNDIFERYPAEVAALKPARGKPVIITRRKEKITANVPKPDISLDDEKYKNLSVQERRILELLLKENMHIDELVRESGIEISNLNATLSFLEMMGHVEKLSGNIYKII